METGWPEAALARGALHEWFGADPPLHLLTHLARRSLITDERQGARGGGAQGGVVIWIGRRVWPFPTPEVVGGPLLERSLFVDPPDDSSRLWAIDLVLRNEAVGAVIADGCRLEMSQTRRLQLAAESGGAPGRTRSAALLVLARPLAELEELSAAATRWRVTSSPSPNARPRWQLEQLRAKGHYLIRDDLQDEAADRIRRGAHGASVGPSQPEGLTRTKGRTERSNWLLEWDHHAQGVVALSPDVVDRPRAASPAPRARQSA
ncbi:MAG: ImuA family protein [Planctomycetota bacterium]